MYDDYPQSGDYRRSINNDPFSNNQSLSALLLTLRNLNEVLQNSEHQKLRQHLGNFLSESDGHTDSPDLLLPAIRYKLYCLLALWE